MNEIQTEQSPLGSWSNLRPHFSKQARILLKKHFLNKFRNAASITQIIIAFLLVFLNLLTYYYTDYTINNNQHPKQEKLTNQSMIDWFSSSSDKVVVVFTPDKPLMHYLIGNTSLLRIAVNGGQVPNTNITFPETIFSYKNTFSQLKSEIFLTRFNAVGFQWENIDDEDALINPKIKISIQSSSGNPTIDFYLQIRDSIIKMRELIENPDSNQSEIYHDSICLNTSISTSPFAHPEITRRSTTFSFGYGILAANALVIASIPDMEAIFEEKENCILAFSFLMGMSETVFWFTNFIASFIINIVIYLAISLVFSFWAGMNDNSFTMIFVVSIFYIIAELWFQYFISTFLNNVKNGRGLLVGLIMASTATAFVFQFATLTHHSGATTTVIYIFSFFPMSAYELFIMQGSIASYTNNIPTYRWNNMNDGAYFCRPWILLVWLIMDFVIYFLLFLVLNAFLPRKYGHPPLKISHFFRCNKKKNQKTSSAYDINNKELKYDANPDSTTYTESEQIEVIKADHLSKKFKGMKDSIALDDATFSVKKGEMIVVIGPNGSGKSTLINCLSRTIKKSGGHITICNHSDNRNVGVCYQKNVLIDRLTVHEHFELFGAYRGVPDDILENRIDYFGETLKLRHMMNNRAGKLSGGQKRKLCISLSLLGNPPVVLMDEPTAGVDVQGRMLIWKMISSLKDTTSIITSHELEEAETLSSRLFIMTNGKISFSGTSTELRKQNKCGYVLRIDSETGDIQNILKLAQSFVPEAEISEDREDVIRMPDNKKIADFLYAFNQSKNELGVLSYTFSVEQLEDVLLNLVYNNQ